MRKIHYILGLAVIIGVASCQKVINIPVDDTEPKFVIEAIYDASKEEVTVHVSQTANVFTKDSVPAINGALVKIIDAGNNETVLNEIASGVYFIDNYSPQFDTEYKMEVRIDGMTYTASNHLHNVVPLDSVTAEYQEGNLFLDEGYLVSMHFQDPFEENYYRVFHTVNGEEITKVTEQMMITDGFSNGLHRTVPIYWKAFEVGDTIQIDFASYSEKTYRYYRDLFYAVQGTEMSAAPTNPQLQWRDESGEKADIMGHFTPYGYDTKSIVIGE